MRKTHTSKPTSKRSPHVICRIFWNFWTSIKKILLDTQIKEFNTKLSTKPNTKQYNVSPTAPQLPNLHHNRPLLLLSRNIRSLALTNPTNLRPNYTQSPIHHIITQHLNCFGHCYKLKLSFAFWQNCQTHLMLFTMFFLMASFPTNR